MGEEIKGSKTTQPIERCDVDAFEGAWTGVVAEGVGLGSEKCQRKSLRVPAWLRQHAMCDERAAAIFDLHWYRVSFKSKEDAML